MLATHQLLKQLERYPLFAIQQFRALTGYSPAYARLALHRLAQQKLIIPIERNKYTVHDDPFLIASHLTWPSYISMWSALRYYNLTDQIVNDIQVVTRRARKNLIFQQVKIKFYKMRQRKRTPYLKKKYNSHEIFIAEPEQALADALYFKTISRAETEEIIGQHRLNRRKLKRLLK